MLFSNARLSARAEGAAADTLRALWSTVASPPTFAIPVDAVEDDEGYTLVFHLAAEDADEVRVRVEGTVVSLRNGAAWRTFRFAHELAVDRLETELDGAELRVRVMKARVVEARKIVVRRGP